MSPFALILLASIANPNPYPLYGFGGFGVYGFGPYGLGTFGYRDSLYLDILGPRGFCR